MVISSILFAFLILSGFAIGQGLFQCWCQSISGRTIIVTFLGLLFLTLCYIALLSIGWANRPVVSILVVTSAAIGLWMHTPKLDIAWRPVLLLFGTLAALPTLIQGIMMGFGDFPKVFFNVDVAYYLQYVHSFLGSGVYPPSRLDNYELPAYGYHYGVMAFGALIAEFTGMKSHTAFLLCVPAIGAVAFLASVNELARTLGVLDSKQRAILIFLLSAGGLTLYFPTVSSEYLFNMPVDAVKHWLKRSLTGGVGYELQGQFYKGHYASLYGSVLCFIVMSLTLNQVYKRHAIGYIFAIMVAPIIKTPYLAFIGIGVGSYSIYRFFITRNHRELHVPVVAGTGMLTTLYLFGSMGSVSGSGFSIEFPGSIISAEPDIPLAILQFGIVSSILLVVTRMYRQIPEEWVNSLWFLLPLIILGLVIEVHQHNVWQLFIPLVSLAYMYMLLIAMRGTMCEPRIGVVAGSSVLFLLLTAGSLYSGRYIYSLLDNPVEAYEYADNRALADVLHHIPVKHSLLVTNDLRYPADNYARDNSQFQLSAVYGHQVFNAELNYSQRIQLLSEKSSRTYEDRLRAKALFKEKTWNSQAIDNLVTRYPITHLLIHESYPHPKDIPLPVVAKNSEYTVYAFE